MSPEEIQHRIVKELKKAFNDPGNSECVETNLKKPKTKLVKETLGTLGRQLGFKVSAKKSDCECADRGEWLYDMCWYQLDECEGEDKALVRLAMALESEWNPRWEGIDADFKKLVQARAEVRVFVFAAGELRYVREYIERCKKQADSFSCGRPDDRYVFAGFDWMSRKVLDVISLPSGA